jgi:secreted PhoX family phosphatase
MTEDESSDQKGLFYRYLPDVPGKLHEGGRLQALAFRGAPEGGDSRNHDEVVWRQGDWKEVFWVDLDGVENPDEDLRFRGHGKGGAWFARGEGVHFGNGELYFTCTSGGDAGCGQVMRYVPSPHEGQPGEKDAPGRLQLFVEPRDPKVLDYGDNLTVTPWGHLLICEDRYSDVDPNHLRGVTPDGKVYTFGRNVFRENAEMAGACFSPDGSTLFVNIYWPGFTLAITGPWNRFQG